MRGDRDSDQPTYNTKFRVDGKKMSELKIVSHTPKFLQDMQESLRQKQEEQEMKKVPRPRKEEPLDIDSDDPAHEIYLEEKKLQETLKKRKQEEELKQPKSVDELTKEKKIQFIPRKKK